ncbi:MAG: nickel pincer cofactor biosynthesis protein LarB [Ruminococcus sp.]|jgi:NCAIR mutase (PurE)-related protein|nr:nickel pincer cofactor biosynthesis protein LarB [Ruminococcus sp.]
MNQKELISLLNDVQKNNITPESAAAKLKTAPFDDLGYAVVDHHRSLRQGVNEVIFGQNKAAEQILGITKNMLENGERDIIITRLSHESAEYLSDKIPLEYHKLPKLGIVNRNKEKPQTGNIIVASGGTSDMFVSEEAALTAEVLGNRVTRLYDVGVAGLHRMLSHLDELVKARVVIAVAGMEGALPSVIGGLVNCPVIAVPTSVGYGASFGGTTALLAMLNSCASGVSVVNIDNGFGAGFIASRINKMGEVK